MGKERVRGLGIAAIIAVIGIVLLIVDHSESAQRAAGMLFLVAFLALVFTMYAWPRRG